MHSSSYNFLSWYKSCCEQDSNVYRNTNYKKNKAEIAYKILLNFDFALYPLDGSQKLFYGCKILCEDYIKQNFNIKFCIFSKKDDTFANYIISNEKVSIIQ